MKRPHTHPYIRLRQVFVVAFLLSSAYALAIDGILSIGDRTKKTNAFSTIRRDLKFSLESGLYQYRTTRVLPNLSPTPAASGSQFMVIMQRGNVNIHIPVSGKASLLHTFRTPTPPATR